MKEHPILFSTAMVKAILYRSKTMTRRTNGLDEVNDRPDIWCFIEEEGIWQFVSQLGSVVNIKCPFGQVGDKLWVREKYALKPQYDKLSATEVVELYGIRKDIYYETLTDCFWTGRARSSRFMPKWASRITLEITEVRVERVQEIKPSDCMREGWDKDRDLFPTINAPDKAKDWFIKLWDSLNAKRGYGWESNCWVWVVSFKIASEG